MAMTGGISKLLKTTYPFSNTSKSVRLYAYYKSIQNADTNESTVLCGMYVEADASIGPWQDNRGSYIGTTSNTFHGEIPNFTGTRWLTENQSFTVKHQDNGAGATVIRWKWGVNSPWGGYEVPSGSFSIALPTIPRTSIPTLSRTSVKMGEELTIETNRKSSVFTHTLKYTIGGTTATFATGVGDSYNWTVPDLAALVNNSLGAQMVISCVTYNGSTLVGTETATIAVSVPDATVPSFPNGVVIGAGNPITTAAKSANFTHTITYSFNGETGDVNSEKVHSGIVWWTPYELASTIPNDPSGTGTITCKTYNGTALVGSKVVGFTATVPDNEITKPTFTDEGFVIAPSGDIPSAFSGLYIQGRTGVKATFDASSTYSTVASYKLSADGRVYTGNPAVSQVLTKDGDVDVVGTVYDARGYYTQRSKTIKVYPYRTPTIEPYEGASSVICERSDGSKNYSDSGTYLHIKAKRSYAPVKVEDVQKNFCDFQYRYRAEGGPWSSPVTIMSGSDTTTDLIDVELLDVVTQTDKSYEVELIVTDTVGATDRYSFPIGTDKVTFHLRSGGRGAAFGKYSEGREDLLECDWDLEVNKSLYAGHIARRDIYDGKDFDELIYHTGYYTSSSAPSTAGCSNYPVDKTGVLEVISQITVNATTGNVWGFAYQTYRIYTGEVYVRAYYTANGWSPWALLTASAI